MKVFCKCELCIILARDQIDQFRGFVLLCILVSKAEEFKI